MLSIYDAAIYRQRTRIKAKLKHKHNIRMYGYGGNYRLYWSFCHLESCKYAVSFDVFFQIARLASNNKGYQSLNYFSDMSNADNNLTIRQYD